MSPSRPAKPGHAPRHLARAEEYLKASRANLDAGFPDVAIANAVVAAVRASDVICTVRLRLRWHGSDHAGAVHLLERAEPEGGSGAQILRDVLPFKSRAQYGLEEFSPEQARDVVDHAEDLVDLARRAVATTEA